jgi:hypothetical protein
MSRADRNPWLGEDDQSNALCEWKSFTVAQDGTKGT